MPMKYRNIKTGAVMDFYSHIRSANWEPVERPAPKTAVLENAEEKAKVAPVQQKKTTRKKKAEE